MESASVRTGEILVREGLIHPDDIQTALTIQEKRKASVSLEKSRLLGMILCDLNLITPIENYAALHKYEKVKTLQSEMVQKKILSHQQLNSLEDQLSKKDNSLISLVLANNIVSMEEMQTLLFDLFHIPFRSISDFIFNKDEKNELVRILDRKASWENKMIPMVLKDNTVLFGITSPENIVAVSSRNHAFPQYRFKALFIPYSGFSWFHKMIYKDEDIMSGQKVEDLSLLLKDTVWITDPKSQQNAVETLYKRYETIRHLLGNASSDDRKDAFARFIRQSWQRLEPGGHGTGVEFSFSKQGNHVMIKALPKK